MLLLPCSTRYYLVVMTQCCPRKRCRQSCRFPRDGRMQGFCRFYLLGARQGSCIFVSVALSWIEPKATVTSVTLATGLCSAPVPILTGFKYAVFLMFFIEPFWIGLCIPLSGFLLGKSWRSIGNFLGVLYLFFDANLFMALSLVWRARIFSSSSYGTFHIYFSVLFLKQLFPVFVACSGEEYSLSLYSSYFSACIPQFFYPSMMCNPWTD